MAANIKTTKNESCREKIQTSQLINRLQQSAMGDIELTNNQLASIKILLSKTLPDMSSIAHTGADGSDLVVQIVRYGDNPASK